MRLGGMKKADDDDERKVRYKNTNKFALFATFLSCSGLIKAQMNRTCIKCETGQRVRTFASPSTWSKLLRLAICQYRNILMLPPF